MEKELQELAKQRKLMGITWNELASQLPITGDGLRLAFKRGSVDEDYLSIIKLRLISEQKRIEGLNEPNITYKTKENASSPSKQIVNIPLVSQYAYAGYLNGFTDPEYIEELETIPFPTSKLMKGVYRWFEVKGDSMFSEDAEKPINEGDYVLGRELQRHHWVSELHINQWYFIIVHKEEGILVKRISSPLFVLFV